MLGSAAPATASVCTETTSASPTRPSRLRGLSYLRNYTHHHILPQSPRPASQPLTRSTSSPTTQTSHSSSQTTTLPGAESAAPSATLQSAENGWIPTIQGRSGLIRESANPTSTSTESASSEQSNAVGMTRSRAATSLVPSATPLPRRPSASGPLSQSVPHGMAEPSSSQAPAPTIRFIPHVETRSTRPSLNFAAVSRTLKTPNGVVRVGRFSERDNSQSDPPVGFKSKVVSRRHCEFWCTDGQWYIKDVKSSSGTFLNHVRLSNPGQESKPYALNDGDVVQLGIDFKGGEEVIFRCVKIRVECNRGWQKGLNNFNTSAHNRLFKNALRTKNRDSDAGSVGSSECSICLNPVAPCQALFVAPCSHVWHFKCIRNLIHGPSYPNFLCPNCRFVADLEADVEPPEDFNHWNEELMEPDMVDVNGHSVRDGSSDDALRQNSGASADEDGSSVAHRVYDTLRSRDGNASSPPSRTTLRPDEAAVSSTSEDPSAPQAANGEARTGTRPMMIASSSREHRAPSHDRLNGRSPTPTSTTQFALAVGPMPDGPLTPRNDVGPFVLDGSAGRRSENRRLGRDPSDDKDDGEIAI